MEKFHNAENTRVVYPPMWVEFIHSFHLGKICINVIAASSFLKNEIHNEFQCFSTNLLRILFQKCLMFLAWQLCAQGWQAIFSTPSILKAGKKSSSGLLVYEIHLADNYSSFNMHSLLSKKKSASSFFGKMEGNVYFPTLRPLRVSILTITETHVPPTALGKS